MIGGAILISSSIPRRGDILTQRFTLALEPVRKNKSSKKPVFQLPSLHQGLKEAEQRQVIRILSRLHIHTDSAVTVFMLLRGITALCAGLLGFMAVNHLGIFGSSPGAQIFFALANATAGWFTPLIIVARSIGIRGKAIAGALPGALELLVVCVEAGLSLEDALERVSDELLHLDPALSEELAITWAEVNILPNRLQAFYNLADRVNIPSVRSIIGMLAQSVQLGTPLAQSLRTSATEMRNDQLRLMEERTSKLPALMTVPVMLFILPTMFLIIGGPAALKIIDNFR